MQVIEATCLTDALCDSCAGCEKGNGAGPGEIMGAWVGTRVYMLHECANGGDGAIEGLHQETMDQFVSVSKGALKITLIPYTRYFELYPKKDSNEALRTSEVIFSLIFCIIRRGEARTHILPMHDMCFSCKCRNKTLSKSFFRPYMTSSPGHYVGIHKTT